MQKWALSSLSCHGLWVPFNRDSGAYSVCRKPQKFSFVLSNAVDETVRVRISAIPFIFFEADVRMFEIGITAWPKRNQNRWHSYLRFFADCIRSFSKFDNVKTCGTLCCMLMYNKELFCCRKVGDKKCCFLKICTLLINCIISATIQLVLH